MKKRIIAVFALMALVFTLPFSATAGENATTSEANIPSEISTQEAKLTAGVSTTMAAKSRCRPNFRTNRKSNSRGER